MEQKICERCGAQFTPESWRNKYCAVCAPIVAKEKLQLRQFRHDAKNCVIVSLKLNRNTDADILGWLDAQPGKQTAIKAAIREKIEKS